MVFSSVIFVFFFLPACLLLYFAVPGIRAKNAVLLLFSLVFYAWGEPVYIVLMLLSVLMNYAFGRYMERIPGWKKGILAAAVFLNLAVLGFFKYFGFAAEIFTSLTGLPVKVHGLPLPIGISFYTFQALSYVIDVYRGKEEAQKSLPDFALYISMFPQLIAGPIVRYQTVAGQLGSRTVNGEGLGRGMARFVFGLAKKVLLANLLGKVFEATGFQLQPVSVLSAWIGLAAYSLQIYFDFSAYSDMAIGLGKMLGFDFQENFDAPYGSASVTEFWRRWHISLGTWFREYVYIPLGGNQVSAARHVFNIMTVWALTGLWHGAAWNFVLWGVYYGVLLLLEKYVVFRMMKVPRFIGHAVTVLLVFLGWGLFLCSSLTEVGCAFANLFGVGAQALFDAPALGLLRQYGALLAASAVLACPFALTLRKKLTEQHPVLLALAAAVLFFLCTAFLATDNYNPFLYFRF